jgi:ABC-2 type transporter.
MGAFLSILKNDAKIIIRDVKALLLLMVLPVLVIALFARALGPMLEKKAFVEPFSIAVVDKENSVWTGMLITQLRNLDILENIYRTDEDNARKMIEENKIAAAIVIPENITESVDRWKPEEGKVIGNGLLHFQTGLVKNIAEVGSTAISAGLAELYAIDDYERAAGIDSKTIYKDINDANEEFINAVLARKEIFRETRQGKYGLSPAEYYAASLIAVFIMFSSVPCMKMLAQERTLGISSRFDAAPSGGWQSIASKLVISVIISTAQFVLVGIFLRLASKSLGGKAGPFIPVFLCTTVAASAFSLFIASISKSAAATDLVANLSILFMAIAGGSVYPLSSLPEICRKLSVAAVNRWASEGFLAVMSGDDAGKIKECCLALLVLAVIYFAAAVIAYRIRRRRPA